MDNFWQKYPEEEFTMAGYMDQSAFDEKFELDPLLDHVNNIYHIENKFMVPVLEGSFRQMYEYCRENLIHPDDEGYASLMNPDTILERFQAAEPPGVLKAEFRRMLVNGTFRWVQYIGLMGQENGVPTGKIYFYVFDIQNQKDRLEGCSLEMKYENDRDSLTGLRKRVAFFPAMAVKLSNIDADNKWCCVAIDIQHFKLFNTWFGYETGNYLLARIGGYLSELEQKEDGIAAYFGRDNFAIVLPYEVEKVNDLYAGIRDIIASYTNIMGFLPALGVVILEKGTKAGFEIYDNARLAVEEAKKNYVDRICYFDTTDYEKARKGLEFLTDFQRALQQEEITFYLQPQCRIADGKIVGAEALARWIRKDGTMVSSGKMAEFLESVGFITELDKYIWEHVCRWIRSLLDRNMNPIPISVNVSRMDLLSMDVAAYLYALTEKYHVPTKFMNVEITESAYMNSFESISNAIEELKKRGFSVFLDDFGAGYSSLNMLDKINVDLIKLDMLFMQKENSLGRKGVSIVESIFGMAKALDLPMIVEGVETADQIRFLKDLGFQYAQGYCFHKPMPIGAFEQILASGEQISRNGLRGATSDLFRSREFLKENMFTENTLNRILGAVAFYSLEGENLTITRFNEPFRVTIGDAQMDSRIHNIQNYVVQADHPMLYHALTEAEENQSEGGECEIRFYKSDGSVFWFLMHFYFLKKDGARKLFFGKVEDITEQREQSIQFFDVLRKQADVTLCIELDNNKISYATGDHTLYQVDLPSMNLDESVRRTAEHRIENEADRKAFLEFFDGNRLREAYQKAVYHEVLNIDFKLVEQPEPMEFSTYYIRYHRNDSLMVYAFAKKREREILSMDPLTGMGNRYAYNEAMAVLNKRWNQTDRIIVFSLDVNGLKSTNDTYGHMAGDELIEGAGQAIREVLSPYGAVYRTGGDEFAAFVYGDRVLADYLQSELKNVMGRWKGTLVQGVSVSCGYVAKEEMPDGKITDLVRTADLRMYRDKSQYYQQQGVDRRMQQVAYNAICNSYTKVLKVNLTEDSYEIIRAEESELKPEQGYAGTLYGWLRSFAMAGLVHPEDREYYLQHTSAEYLQRHFHSGKKQYCIYYRRRFREDVSRDGYDSLSCAIGGEESYRRVMMEMIMAPDYREDNQKLFLYVKDIDNEEFR